MKNLKALMMLLIGVFALTVTSCNSYDSDHYYTQEEQQAIQSKMYGTYGGKLIMYKPNSTTGKAEDYYTISTTWSAYKGNAALGEDSLITVSEFPINMLDSAINIPNTDDTDEIKTLRALRTAISELPAEDLKCKFSVPSDNSYYTFNNGYRFILNPLIVKKQLTYEGKSHDVYFVFAINSHVGEWTMPATSGSMKLYMRFVSISVDKNPLNNLQQFYYPSFSLKYLRQLIITCGYDKQ